MDEYAAGNESYSEYFTHAFGYLILFSVLAAIALGALITSGFCISFP